MARKTKIQVEIAVSQLEELFKTDRLRGYSERDLADLVGLTEKTVRKHVKDLRGKVGSRTIEAITDSFIEDLHTIMDDYRKYWREAREKGEESQILFYSKKMMGAWKEFAFLLETFGIKEKVADKVDHNVLNEIIISFEEPENIIEAEVIGE